MMKTALGLSIVASTVIMAGGNISPVEPEVERVVPQSSAVNSFWDALKNGNYTTHLRLFYMDRSFDEDKSGKPDAQALTAGGVVKYESGDYYGLKVGFAYYGSHRVGTFFSREEGIGTSLLQPDGDDIAFLGEAYLQYTRNNTMLKVGRQQLSTPLMNGHDLRLVPSVYEAAMIQNRDIADTLVELGYVTRYSGFGSKFSGFDDRDTIWGEDGLGYIYVKSQALENLTLRGQYIKALSDTDATGAPVAVEDYRYIDAKYTLPVGTNTYIKAQYGGNSYNDADDSLLLGAKVGTTLFDMVDVALLYDKISDNNFNMIESGPMYSDWQQGYGAYEPSSGVGGQVTFRPITGLSVKLGYVDVSSDTERLVDDFTEFNLDMKYKINDYSKVRIRYSRKDQSDASEALYYDGIDDNGGHEDRDDFRVIYYINF